MMTLFDKFKETVKAHSEAVLAFSLALTAAAFIKAPELFGIQFGQDEHFYIKNVSLFVLPLLTVYFAWKRQVEFRMLIGMGLAFVVAAIFANGYPLHQGNDTEALLALHLPIALWLIVGVAFSGGEWDKLSKRMDFIRFSGELFIYYVLIALGGGVLTAFMFLIFGTIEIDVEPFFESWLLPCGATGAVIIASWLVETTKSMTENMAPILSRFFTPLFTIVLIAFLGTLLWTGRGIEIDRNVLIAFDMLLVLVLALLLYNISARDPESPAGVFDVIQVVLVVSMLLADAVALWAISERITELGLTPNRVTALGMNLILLVNLSWSTVLYIRFLSGGASFSALEQWQMNYLPVYAGWAAIVAILFPPLFGFM